MTSNTDARQRVLIWFDHDLRLDDNPALAEAARRARELICLYCDDEARFGADRFGTPRQGTLRSEFIDASLADLAAALERNGQRLLRRRGDPVRIVGELIERFDIDAVVRSRHFGLYEKRQWQALQQRHAGIEFVEIDGYTLFDGGQLMRAEDFPATFSRFRRCVESIPVAEPGGRIALPPPVAAVDYTDLEPRRVNSGDSRFTGGEAAAVEHLRHYFAGSAPSTYKQTRNELDGWSNSARLSPWLAAGCLSVRRVYQAIRRYEDVHGANDSTYWLVFELLWREFFQWYAEVHAVCLFRLAGLNDRPPKTGFNAGRFESWCAGRTAWPLVNACMTQLNRTGYLSNRGRQLVASALIYELGLDWRAGAGYFEQCLIDYDVASNWGNWQYIAGVGADARGGRRFNIARQTRQFDPDGVYVRRWLHRDEEGEQAGHSPAA